MNQLDDQIRAWSKRREQEAPAVGEPLVDRVLARLDQESTRHPREVETQLRRRLRLTRLALAAALVLVVGAAIVLILQRNAHDDETHARDTATAVITRPTPGITLDDVEEVRAALTEIERLFPEGIRWITKINGQLSIQPGPAQRIIVDGDLDRPLLVRYQVMRKSPTHGWQIIATHDIVTYTNEPVETGPGAGFSLWAHQVTGERAVIDVEMQLDGLLISRETLQLLETSQLLYQGSHEGQPVRVYQSIHGI